MSLEWVREALSRAGDREAVIEGEQVLRYPELLQRIDTLRGRLRAWGLRPGDVLAFAGDYSSAGLTRFVATVLEGLVAVPLATTAAGELRAALGEVPTDGFWAADAPLDQPPERLLPPGERSAHPLLEALRDRGHAGVVILTSGSTGRPKVILHDAERLLDKLRHPRRPYRALVFLLPDHMGGVNTLFGMLTAGSTLILPTSRDADSVCALVARHRADLLPVTPSFLTLLLASEAWRRHDLSSLAVVSYGTEVMPEATLRRAVELLPGVRFVQLYGSSELGIFRSRSAADDSTFLALHDEGMELEVVDGRLRVRGADSMLGCLCGQPSGFDEQGWYDTGDLVEERDGRLRFLGRASELINVGGQKVYPAEVEEALLQLDGVEECSVFGEAHALTGQVVVARIRPRDEETAAALKRRVRRALSGRLEPYKLPVRVYLAEGSLVSRRYKKIRR